MKLRQVWKTTIAYPLLAALSGRVSASDVLSASGVTSCLSNSTMSVNTLNVQYDRSDSTITFDVAGSSEHVQNVTALLTVTAYGNQVYQKTFDPCAANTQVKQLCPVPAGNFAARGSQDVPSNYANMIPSIAYTVPDLEGEVKVELRAANGQDVACVQSSVTNGKTADSRVVSYIAAGVAGLALILTGISTAGSGAGAGSAANFGLVLGWFQGVSMNGMHSVSYPPVYRSFTKNFAFSNGLIPWQSMQTSIDSFRQATGGNLTADSVKYLQNATLVYNDGSVANSSTVPIKRSIRFLLKNSILSAREISADVNGTGAGTATNGTGTVDGNKVTHLVTGIEGYVEQLTIPQANTFMTVLLIFAIVLAAIAIGILLFKVILETWALFGSFPKKLAGFRKRYWGLLGKTVTNLILLLYGVWVLFCIYQFTHGDSWGAKLLAGFTLATFTALLGFFTVRIWLLARKAKKAEGDASMLYEDKQIWLKYSLFYDNYKRGYWWLFMPVIVYMFAKGCVLAAGDGHGLAQTTGQLVIESLMLVLLLWSRPFATKAGNWINMVVQVVRVLSVICILVFVEELGIAQTTKTITGVILIVVQSVLTAVLAILIAVNAIINCCRVNPHRKRRKEAEKLNRDLDDLTPLDARNSLLMDPADYHDKKFQTEVYEYPLSTYASRSDFGAAPPYRPSPARRVMQHESAEQLVGSAARMGHSHSRSTSWESEEALAPVHRQPTVPDMGYRGVAY